MAIEKSDVLELIYAEAQALRRKYGSSNVSQLHVIGALLMTRLRGEESVRTHPELEQAVELLSLDEQGQVTKLGAVLDSFKQDPLTTFEEITALEDCYELAQISASIGNEPCVTVPMLVRKIMENPTDKTNDIFRFVFRHRRRRPTDSSAPSKAPTRRVQNDVIDEKIKEIDKILEEFDEGLFDDDLEEMARVCSQTTIEMVVEPIKRMQQELRERVYGQDEAISAVVGGYFNALARGPLEAPSSSPRATFLFAGAPGVGKTYLAQVAAQAMQLPFRRFDMSSFSDKEAALEFSGSDKVYRNGHEGLVTGFVREHPNCVLLFDEIEKAHINIIHLFLQILDAGRLKDSHSGENVSFKDTIIIMTTNAGRSLYDTLEPGAPLPGRKVIVNALATERDPSTGNLLFPEAICSRFAAGNIVLFNPLGAQELLGIGQACLAEYAARFKKNFKIDLTFDDNVCAALLFAEGGRVDARALKGRAANFISSEVYNWVRFAHEKEDIKLDGIKSLCVRTDVGDSDAARLFAAPKKPTVLLFSEKPTIFTSLVRARQFRFLVPKTKEQAEELIAAEEIDLAICDIFGSEAPTLNIEDTASDGRRLMDSLIRERIPVYIYSAPECRINAEERQALSESGATGFFEKEGASAAVARLEAICKRVYSEKMLRELGRARKVLTFDCVYDRESASVGTICIRDLRVIPAIDAQDRQDIAGLCATDTTFDSIIGAEDAKAELKGFISYLKEPRLYAKNGIPAPKGIILYGPPGTGKTMLAKALAHESGATFIATQGNNFLTARQGGGAQEVKRLFAMARKYAPSVLFIDEIDIVAKDRMTNGVAGDVVNALLNEMDGFATNTARPVFVLAATNFDVSFGSRSALDAALLRRFDRRIFVDLPDRQERLKFIRERLARSHQALSDSMIENVVLRSTGMSLAELESVVDFALRSMLQRGQTALTDRLFDEAFETFRFGEKEEWNEELIHRISIHEAGHAVISYLCGNKPAYLTVAGRSNFGGYMHSTSDAAVQTKKRLLGEIRTALGGRAAEIVFFGEEDGISAGAAGDLKAATEIALRMITVYGMSDEHGIMYDDDGPTREETIRLCNRVLAEELDNAVALLRDNRDKVQTLVDALVSKNHLMGKEIEAILAN
ncbi:MAG: AAA family ATPase [Clostridia bacterium]|nr:AAA family ATPase [Clostridia bacterium]